METIPDSKYSTEREDSSWVVLGRILGAHGLRGQLRVKVLGDGGNLLFLEDVMLAPSESGLEKKEFQVVRAAPGRKQEVRLELEGLRGRDEAEAFRGWLVLGRPENLEPLQPGEYYWHELLGCRVEDLEGNFLGTVTELMETGAHDVLVVERNEGEKALIPTVDEFLREVDTEGKRIVVATIPGLIE